VRVHLGGHLSWYEAERRAWLEVHPAGPATPLGLLQTLGVPPGEVAIVTVNRKAASLEGTDLVDDDTIEFYPAVGGG
jgi:sulfur carrier protein ThiS